MQTQKNITSKGTDCSHPLMLKLCSEVKQDFSPFLPSAEREQIPPYSCEGDRGRDKLPYLCVETHSCQTHFASISASSL